MAARSKRPELPENLMELTESLTTPAIPDADLARLSGLLDASPEDFQRAAASLFRRLAVEGFRTIQAPRNYKELATAIDLWRKLEGLDKADKGSVIPAGLVRAVGGISRRVLDAVEVVPDDLEPGFE